MWRPVMPSGLLAKQGGFVLLAILLLGGNAGCGRAATDLATTTGLVGFIWAGAVTPTSVRVNARMREEHAAVRLVVSPNADLSEARYSDYATTETGNDGVVSIEMGRLEPHTQYYYAMEVNGRVDTTHRGQFRTFADGPFSFRVALGSCAETGSNHPVFDAIRETDPDLFLHMGDMHYENIDASNRDAFRTAFRDVLTAPRQAALYRSAPIAYMWDDHDYGANNSSRRSPSREEARRTYQEYVPHYELAAGKGDVPIYQAFTVGRVRFILTDLRSMRSRDSAPDTEEKTMMGAQQKAWFKQELLEADGTYPVIAWVSTVPWIITPEEGGDQWNGFTTERRELAAFIEEHDIQGLVMLSGDAHMVAIDDGSNNQYAEGRGPGFPVIHAAALDRPGSKKGGPYSEGAYPNRSFLFGLGKNDGQFVVMDIADEGGDQVCVTWTGRRYEYDTGHVVGLVTWQKCFASGSEEASGETDGDS